MGSNVDAYRNYDAPKSAGMFFKLDDGKTAKIRIVTDCFIYMDAFRGGPSKPRYVWGIWNFTEERAQVWQASVTTFERIQDLVKNDEWGDPVEYNLTVTREGVGLDTKYPIDPSPNNRVDIKSLLTKDDLESLYGLDLYEALKKDKTELVPLSNADELVLEVQEGAKPAPASGDVVIKDLPDGELDLNGIPF